MNRVLVLLGAGASVEYEAPSTQRLTQIIEQAVAADATMKMLGGDKAFQKIKAGLASYLANPAAINFEQIYHCAHELIFTNPVSPGAADEFKPIMQPFVANTSGLRNDVLKLVCSKIVEIIYKEFSHASASNTLSLDPLAEFIETLRRRYIVRIYTTNYDDFLLQAAPDLYTGFSKTSFTGPRPFDIKNFWHRERADSLSYLHGSIRLGYQNSMAGTFEIGDLFWYDDRDEALSNSSFSGSSPSRMDGTSVLRTPIITGLEKLSRVQQRPFSHFYSMMARDAMRSDVIFVIGSGLADLHLNTWLAEARSRSPKPALVFIDYWPNGYEVDTMEVDNKGIQLFHRLQVHLTDTYIGSRVGNWLITADRTAAVWDKGFQKFLNASDGKDAVLGMLAGVPSSTRMRRLVRRIYRSWSKYRAS